MLKALELVGFKSFADRTRFAFPPGITVVVGPNGSGKSNIVDSIKWVLGEQSVKSLRGKEMADVIFNGSPTRRGMNSAEITLTFDNSNHLFPIDSPEVHITRRVYRGGEGEYLINRNPSRLRDIRDLLTGTGLGTQAYSVIEQGKVDILLQSSPRDRRLIFEEAAGISRFKLKKNEALRRLERVQQNLVRLADIVEEVESRLRSVRAQAGKAKRYKEYTDRLQELRTQVGLGDWRRLSARLTTVESELTALVEQRDAASAAAEGLDAQILGIETQIAEINETVRRSEAEIAANRERIAAQESTVEHDRGRCQDLEQEMSRYRRQMVTLSARADDLEQQLEQTHAAVAAAEENRKAIAQRLVEGERALTEATGQLDQVRGENEQRRSAYLETMRAVATLGSQISRLEGESAAANATCARCQERLAELHRQVERLARELSELEARRETLAQAADDCLASLIEARSELAHLDSQHALRHSELAELRQRHSGMAERASVIEELERRQEGMSAGVKEIMARVAQAGTGPFRAVRGLVADLFSVSVEMAPLVDAALGLAAQHAVAEPSEELVTFLRDHSQEFSGRVGFIWLEPLANATPAPAIDLEDRPGVCARADRLVETSAEYTALATRLLGRTWVVEKLADAMHLAASTGRGLNYVTLAGELLLADGTLVVGPRQAVAGLISRRSQLRALRTELAGLEKRISEGQAATDTLQKQIATQQQQVERRTDEQRQAAEALAEQRLQLTACSERKRQIDSQHAALEEELHSAQEQQQTAVRLLDETQQQRQRNDTLLAEMEETLAGLGQRLAALEAQRQAHGRDTTEAKVELAKSEERLGNLQGRLRQFEENRQERGRAIADSQEQLSQCVQRLEAARWSILRAESEIAELYLRKEGHAAQTVQQINGREALRQQRGALAAEAQKARSRMRRLDEQMHSREMAANEVRHERETLATRMREDYGIELASLDHDLSDDAQRERSDVQQEIDELRQKINSLGNVNLEALDELQSLETRFKVLSDQYKDLSGAKSSLEKIIDKINADSRRLFSETLQTVRGHFQTLFRDLFGGGQGDIVLEEGVDILETGIEIVARPPGKEPRSISLLSGGEKTMTCVALLLAMFRSRPSPFCVLDEVDAALDEANIDRFTKVLQDFLTWTQFIIVTHSKKTMTCANTIYGVTMQESGVSKQVSVQFEDVSEDGHILPERLAEADQEQAA